jgi:hypothetical protein
MIMPEYQHPFTEAILENIADGTVTVERYQERQQWHEENNKDLNVTEPYESIKEALAIQQSSKDRNS